MYFLIMLGDLYYDIAWKYLSWTITLLSEGFYRHKKEKSNLFHGDSQQCEY